MEGPTVLLAQFPQWFVGDFLANISYFSAIDARQFSLVPDSAQLLKNASKFLHFHKSLHKSVLLSKLIWILKIPLKEQRHEIFEL